MTKKELIPLDAFLATYHKGVERYRGWTATMKNGRDPEDVGVKECTFKKWKRGDACPEPVNGVRALRKRRLCDLDFESDVLVDFARLAAYVSFEGTLRHDFGVQLYFNDETKSELDALVKSFQLRAEEIKADFRIHAPANEMGTGSRPVSAKAVGRALYVSGVTKGQKKEGLVIPQGIVQCIESDSANANDAAKAFLAVMLNTQVSVSAEGYRQAYLPLQRRKGKALALSRSLVMALNDLFEIRILKKAARACKRTTTAGVGYSPRINISPKVAAQLRANHSDLVNGRFEPDFYSGKRPV
jgi:hypothetical protein